MSLYAWTQDLPIDAETYRKVTARHRQKGLYRRRGSST